MQAEPQKEHHWLDKMLGEWTYEHEAVVEPGKPPEKFRGTDSVRSLGGLWVVCEAEGNMPGGGTARTIMTIGYDPAKQRYVGTFIASMMTNLWIYEGTLDESGKMLTLEAEGPSFTAEGKMTKYKDIIEFKSDDERTLTSKMLGEDGNWVQFMEATYRRVK